MSPEIFVGLPIKQQYYAKHGIKMNDPNDIIKATCSVLDLRYEDIISKLRTRDLVIARQISMALIAFTNPDLSLKNIGKMFGNRHHSTVIYSKEQYSDLYGRDKFFTKIADRVKLITNEIQTV